MQRLRAPATVTAPTLALPATAHSPDPLAVAIQPRAMVVAPAAALPVARVLAVALTLVATAPNQPEAVVVRAPSRTKALEFRRRDASDRARPPSI